MVVFLAVSNGNKLSFGSEYNKARFLADLKENPRAKYRIERLTPESKNQRNFYHGAVLPLWAYLNGWDYKDSNLLEFMHMEAKKEFNGEILILDGKKVKVGKSTKGQLNKGFIEKVIEHLEEQYAIDRAEVLNPEDYKYYRDVVYGDSTYDSYIDYLVDLKKLHRVIPK